MTPVLGPPRARTTAPTSMFRTKRTRLIPLVEDARSLQWFSPAAILQANGTGARPTLVPGQQLIHFPQQRPRAVTGASPRRARPAGAGPSPDAPASQGRYCRGRRTVHVVQSRGDTLLSISQSKYVRWLELGREPTGTRSNPAHSSCGMKADRAPASPDGAEPPFAAGRATARLRSSLPPPQACCRPLCSAPATKLARAGGLRRKAAAVAQADQQTAGSKTRRSHAVKATEATGALPDVPAGRCAGKGGG